MEGVGLEVSSDQSRDHAYNPCAYCPPHVTSHRLEQNSHRALPAVLDQYFTESILSLGFYSGFALSEAEGIILSD